MSPNSRNPVADNVPAAIHPGTLRTGLALVIFVSMVAFAARATAQPSSSAISQTSTQAVSHNVAAATGE